MPEILPQKSARRWRAVAVDDEPPALKRMAALLADVEGFELVAALSEPGKVAAALRELRPDVLFLDIHMPGMSGFDVLRSLDGDVPVVVVVTAFDEHAIRAFEHGAVDYLLKPVQRDRFQRTIERVQRRLTGMSQEDLRLHLDAVLRLVRGPGSVESAPARVAVRVRDRTTLLDPAEIDRVDAEGNVLHVQTARGRYSFRETLTAFAERLPAGMFVRVNRATVLNVARVRCVEPWFNGDFVLVLTDGTKVTSGRAYRSDVRARLGLK